MICQHLLAAAFFAALGFAEPVRPSEQTTSSRYLSPRTVHEQRDALPSGWRRARRHAPDAPLPLRVGLAQRNMHMLDAYLMDVSTPDSANYGQHWTAEQVVEAFAPGSDTVDAVRAWLETEGVGEERVRVAGNRAWLEVEATVEEAERLLSAEYHVYEHDTGARHIGCERYRLPEHVRDHIELITPTIHFDTKIPKRDRTSARLGPDTGTSRGKLTIPLTDLVKAENKTAELEQCYYQMTPTCLEALYDIDYTVKEPKLNSFAVAEFAPSSYLKSDLDSFFANFSPALVGRRPIEVDIAGGIVQKQNQSEEYISEGSLDLQYSMALAKNQNVTLYQIGDMVEGATFNTFLDAIDGTYCSFEGGDDPKQDPKYPDPYKDKGAFKGKHCGTIKPANVISTSYGYNEVDLPRAYAERQCAEYGKLGLMGVTVLFATGDDGVAGEDGTCVDSKGRYSESAKIFVPSFPATCPYVTAVGATQISRGKTVKDPETAAFEIVYSGGGFSNYFAIPEYQKDAVAGYLKYHKPEDKRGVWNATGTSRAYPDVSANGSRFAVSIHGARWLFSGTSASTPVLGAIITLINDARLHRHRPPLGFINPALYSARLRRAGALRDVTNGTNPGCGTDGFGAAEGWDPVTGVGTPNFPRMLGALVDL